MDEERQPEPAPPSKSGYARLEFLKTYGNLASVGLSFVIAIGHRRRVGWWLDKITGWSPICFIFFFLVGLAAGIRNVYLPDEKVHEMSDLLVRVERLALGLTAAVAIVAALVPGGGVRAAGGRWSAAPSSGR